MYFTCSKTALCSAIAHVSKGVAVKSPHSALEGICISTESGCITLTGYDMEIGIRTTIPAVCEESFSFVLNARLFGDMTRKLTGEDVSFHVETAGDAINVGISCGNTKFRISAISAEDYPELPIVDTTIKTAVPQSILRSMIMESSFAASIKEDKPILTGELFESGDSTLYIVAMDRYRLAMRQESLAELGSFRFVVPKKALNELIALLSDDAEIPCEFSTNGKHIVFCVNGFQLFARLLEGNFHNFRSSIPAECKTTVVMDTRDVIGCAERCALMINEKNKSPMRCIFDGGFMEISCSTAIGTIQDKIPAEIEGEALTIGFSNKYLLEALRSCQCDRIKISMSGSNRVIKITPVEDESFVYLIMPIQLKN